MIKLYNKYEIEFTHIVSYHDCVFALHSGCKNVVKSQTILTVYLYLFPLYSGK